MLNTLVIAPHADDETLGCGGTILRHIKNGDKVHWCIVTSPSLKSGHSNDFVTKRNSELLEVTKFYNFSSTHELKFQPCQLTSTPETDLISALSTVVSTVKPDTLYIPFDGDAHSDHWATFSAACACTKWFRYPSIKNVRVYETISETDVALSTSQGKTFSPNLFIDISEFLDDKINAMKLFPSEIGEFPFPRSEQAIKALAHVRGASSGYQAAEAFMNIYSRF